jgi:hypothetical protein
MSRDLEGQGAVERWLVELGRHWEIEFPPHEVEARRLALGRFCAMVGQTPDQLIEACMVEANGQRRVAPPAIRKYWTLIREFARQHGPDEGRFVISFFVHNGVLMQAPGA